MTQIAIVPIASETGDIRYRAIAGERESDGRTAGEALDALTAQLSPGSQSLTLMVSTVAADTFFPVEKQLRLNQLMEDWRAARERHEELPHAMQQSLEQLVEEELLASTQRAAAAGAAGIK